MKAASRTVQATHEHELEDAHGLPEALPPGERVLWQGAPDWRALAVDTFHVRAIGIYFAVILVLRGGLVLVEGGGVGNAALSVLWLAPLAAFAIGTLTLIAWLSARTTVYTLTNRRIVMRIGIVLTLAFNLPLKRVASAGLRLRSRNNVTHGANTGDIPLELAAGDKIAYAHLWPHARPWRVANPQPMLRCVPDAETVASVLVQAWSLETGQASADLTAGVAAAQLPHIRANGDPRQSAMAQPA